MKYKMVVIDCLGSFLGLQLLVGSLSVDTNNKVFCTNKAFMDHTSESVLQREVFVEVAFCIGELSKHYYYHSNLSD